LKKLFSKTVTILYPSRKHYFPEEVKVFTVQRFKAGFNFKII